MSEGESLLTYVYYPRGFRRLVAKAPNEPGYKDVKDRTSKRAMYASEGDSDVNSLYRDYLSSEVDTSTSEYLLRVVSAAQRLIVDWENFARQQEQNHYVQGHTFEFLNNLLADLTGKAKVELGHADSYRCVSTLSPTSAISMMDDEPEAQRVDGTRRLPVTFNRTQKGGGPLFSTIELWLLTYPDIEHIVTTLYVLFGAPRSMPISQH